MNILQNDFGRTRLDEVVTRYVLVNDHGMEVAVLNLGGIIQSILTTDKHGQAGDVVLGCDSVADYEQQEAYLGAIAGRYANRINKGRLMIAGKHYQLARNNGSNHLHGGNVGLNQRIWSAKTEQSETEATVELRYRSKDGEENYPGSLDICVRYTLNNQNELMIDYHATTDKTTVVNLTNHSYFNLRGYGDCREHKLQVLAEHFTPTDETAIPTGEIMSVKETPMDFTEGKFIGQDMDVDYQQLIQARGYDHNWVIRQTNETPEQPKLFARAEEYESGRFMEASTTQPGVQIYTGNYLTGQPAKGKKQYQAQDGFCLETQHFPDSPNHKHFPSTELKPGEIYSHRTVFRFGLLEE